MIYAMEKFPQNPVNGKEGKETERPWLEQRLNTYTSLERPGAQHIGTEFEVSTARKAVMKVKRFVE